MDSIKHFTLFRLFFFAALISEFSNPALPKIEAPNYSFKLKDLEPFYPNKTIDTKNKKLEYLGTLDGAGLYNTTIKQNNYHLEVFLHLGAQQKVSHVKITLPYYFVHDVFLKSLIKQFGKDYIYQNKDAHAFYRWEKHDQFLIHYEGGCSNTCFPIYLEMTAKKLKD
jgi:hypothetical protein